MVRTPWLSGAIPRILDAMAENQSQLVQRAGGVQAYDRLAVERWIDEGGRIATEAVIEREMAARTPLPLNALPRNQSTDDHRASARSQP